MNAEKNNFSRRSFGKTVLASGFRLRRILVF